MGRSRLGSRLTSDSRHSRCPPPLPVDRHALRLQHRRPIRPQTAASSFACLTLASRLCSRHVACRRRHDELDRLGYQTRLFDSSSRGGQATSEGRGFQQRRGHRDCRLAAQASAQRCRCRLELDRTDVLAAQEAPSGRCQPLGPSARLVEAQARAQLVAAAAAGLCRQGEARKAGSEDTSEA